VDHAFISVGLEADHLLFAREQYRDTQVNDGDGRAAQEVIKDMLNEGKGGHVMREECHEVCKGVEREWGGSGVGVSVIG